MTKIDNSVESALLDSLIDTEIAVWNRLERALNAEPGTTSLGRHYVLRTIERLADTGARINDIARSQRITVGAASRLIDRLVTDGLVDRRTADTDRRATHLALTDDGRRALSASTAALAEELHTLFSPLTAKEQRSLDELLQRLRESADTARAASPSPAEHAQTGDDGATGRARAADSTTKERPVDARQDEEARR